MKLIYITLELEKKFLRILCTNHGDMIKLTASSGLNEFSIKKKKEI